jgi:hypothetical protein
MSKHLYGVLTTIISIALFSGCREHNLVIRNYGKYELRHNFYSEWPYYGRRWADHDDFCLKGTDECVYYGEADIVEMGPIAVVHDPNTLAFFNTQEGFKYSCHYQVYGKKKVYHLTMDGDFQLVFIKTERKMSDMDYKSAETYLYQLKFEGRQCNAQALLKENKGVILKSDWNYELNGKYTYAWEWCDERCYVSWKFEDSNEIKTMVTNCDPSRKISLEWKDGKPVLYVHQNTGDVNSKCDLPPF